MAADPDNMILTDEGLAYIRAQVAGGNKAKISYFKLGDSNLFVPNEADIAIFGNTVYQGPEADIYWVEYSANEIIFRCLVESDKGDFLIGNIGVYSDTDVLLFIAKFAYIHHKMKSTESAPGGRWTAQFRIVQENIQTAWDFSNLTTRYAAMETHQLADAPAHPFDSFYTELQLDETLLPTNRSAFINVSGDVSRHWYCSPFQMLESNVIVFERFDLDGGDEGDSHQGVW